MNEIHGLNGSVKISEIKDIGDCISIEVCERHGKLVDLSTNKTQLEEWINAFGISKNTSIDLGENVVIVRHMRGNALVQIFKRHEPVFRLDAIFNSDQKQKIISVLKGFLSPIAS